MDLFLDVLSVTAIAVFIIAFVATPLYLMLKYAVKHDHHDDHMMPH